MSQFFSLFLAASAVASTAGMMSGLGTTGGGEPASAVSKADSTAEETFGAPITLDRNGALDVATVVGDAKLQGNPVLVRGSIIDVCSKAGCWLVVTDGKTQMRVTFKDYKFFVPKNSAGRTVLLEGIVTRQEVSQDDARHYAGESTIGGQKPEEINGPQLVVTMVATGVVIR
jgi:hypothetical protein